MRVQITSRAGVTTVHADGVKIGGLMKVEFDVSVEGRLPRLRLTILPDRLELDADALTQLIRSPDVIAIRGEQR